MSTTESNLVTHARHELELIGEDTDVIDWFLRVVREFASYGHSGGSASVCIPRLDALLRYQNIAPLTADPSEWEDRTEMSGAPLWQSQRNPEAFSIDGGGTYYLLSEKGVMHTSAPARKAAGQ